LAGPGGVFASLVGVTFKDGPLAILMTYNFSTTFCICPLPMSFIPPTFSHSNASPCHFYSYSKVADELDSTRVHARATQRLLDRLEKQMEVSRARTSSITSEQGELIDVDSLLTQSTMRYDLLGGADIFDGVGSGEREQATTPTPTAEETDALVRHQSLAEELQRARDQEAQIAALQTQLQNLRDALEERDIELQSQQRRFRSESFDSSGSDRLSPERLCGFDSCVACGQMFMLEDASVCDASDLRGGTHQSAREMQVAQQASIISPRYKSPLAVRAARVVLPSAAPPASTQLLPTLCLLRDSEEDEFASAEEPEEEPEEMSHGCGRGQGEVVIRQERSTDELGLDDILLFFDCEEPPDPLAEALAGFSRAAVGTFLRERGRVSKGELEAYFVGTLAHHGRAAETRAQAALRTVLCELEADDEILVALDDQSLQVLFVWRRQPVALTR